MCEFMDKMLKAQKKHNKTLIREVSLTYDDIMAMPLDEIETKAKEISSEAKWEDVKAKQLFEYKVLDAQAPRMIEKARG